MENYQYNIKGLRRDSQKNFRKDKSHRGIHQNKKGQIYGEIKFMQDNGTSPILNQSRDYYKKITKGHKSTIEDYMSQQVLGNLAKGKKDTIQDMCTKELEQLAEKFESEHSGIDLDSKMSLIHVFSKGLYQDIPEGTEIAVVMTGNEKVNEKLRAILKEKYNRPGQVIMIYPKEEPKK